jgi:hypothetical protein
MRIFTPAPNGNGLIVSTKPHISDAAAQTHVGLNMYRVGGRAEQIARAGAALLRRRYCPAIIATL